MSLHVYKIQGYDHIASTQQFEALRHCLDTHYEKKTDEAILIGGYAIDGMEIDALLLSRGGCHILSFKHQGGDILAREHGMWTSNGRIINGGHRTTSPYRQARRYKDCIVPRLQELLGIEPSIVSVLIVFTKDARIDDSQLSPETKEWLQVCDHRQLSDILCQSEYALLSNDFLLTVPQKLGLDAYIDTDKGEHQSSYAIRYTKETAADHFASLTAAMSLRPDFREAYRAMSQIFRRCLSQHTDQVRVLFSGDFAKLDYLLAEYKASDTLRASIGDTRIRLRRRHDLSTAELQTYCLHDLRNICEFIALLFKVDIPKDLVTLFPKVVLPKKEHTPISPCMRIVVKEWDENYIYGLWEDATDGQLIQVRYTPTTPNDPNDWSYLRRMLHPGVQLNLVRPRKENDGLHPELIVFEPDYLVNVSTVAHCFTNYADSGIVELLNKLAPKETTSAILLGNFAGQLLDESIHRDNTPVDYAQSVQTFFKQNALNLLTTPIDHTFHKEAQQQRQHIETALHTTLPSLIEGFDSRGGIVEPSFYAEMLGLQGRIDYLQEDFSVLMEQKSGKGAFPYDGFKKPRHTDAHYVQVLLYMAVIKYNFSKNYKQIRERFHPFLLYSKYDESLLAISTAPALLKSAMRVRNEVAYMETYLAKSGGYRILEELTPERINLKQTTDNLWQRYQRPAISHLLDTIHQSSALEKAYFYRFLTFIAGEHLLSKIGNKVKENAGFAVTWHDTLDEKQASGNIYADLKLSTLKRDERGRVTHLTMLFPQREMTDISNFRAGDIVMVYRYASAREPDARQTMVHRCTISHIGTHHLFLRLRAPQSSASVFATKADEAWAIEHDFMESSYSSLYKSMMAFLHAPKERRDLLLLQRTPRIDKELHLKGDYGTFNELVLGAKRAQDLFLIIGPPGTGKTSFGLLYTVKEELLDPTANILLVSYTNRAVDEICHRLAKEGIDFVRLGHTYDHEGNYSNNLLDTLIQESESLSQLRNKILSKRVFVSTTSTIDAHLSLLQLKTFSLAIIDEASQILEPHLLGILTAQKNGESIVKKFVLIGDHKQLPAVVQQTEEVSRVHDIELRQICLTDCRLSLFERLLKRYAHQSEVAYMLKKHGRMHPDIARFPNQAFYGNQLQAVPTAHQSTSLPFVGEGKNGIADLLSTRRIAFINTMPPKHSLSDKVNEVEAEMIAATVVNIYERECQHGFKADKTVGVIVPYRNQIATIRRAIEQYNIAALHDIAIDTVERYQGSQRKYIIYGFTIQKPYQLQFLTAGVFQDEIDGSIVDRKLNVAMTRAEEHLLLFGNATLLSQSHTFAKLIEFLAHDNCLFEVSKEDFIKGKFTVPPLTI